MPGTSVTRRYLKIALTLVVGAIVIWVSLGVTLAQVYGRKLPEVVLAIWPASSKARAHFAMRQFLSDPKGAGHSGLAGARTALAHDPLNATAVYMLALAAANDGQQTRAARLARYSERLTRRHLPTQLWLIEDAVSRGDLDAVLRHYDRAMRSSSTQRGILLPVLVDATVSEPLVASAISRRVASRPPWWADYYSALLNRVEPASGLFQTSFALNLNANLPSERDLLERALSRLVEAQRFKEAERLYAAAMDGTTAEASIRPIRAPGRPALPPFDWDLVDEVGFGAIAEPSPADPEQWALFLTFDNRGEEIAARQLLRLTPGRYRLKMRAGDVVEAEALARPQAAIECNGGTPIANFGVPTAPDTGRTFAFEFAVPAGGCPAQWLTLSPGSSLDRTGDNRPWFDSFAVRRMGGGS